MPKVCNRAFPRQQPLQRANDRIHSTTQHDTTRHETIQHNSSNAHLDCDRLARQLHQESENGWVQSMREVFRLQEFIEGSLGVREANRHVADLAVVGLALYILAQRHSAERSNANATTGQAVLRSARVLARKLHRDSDRNNHAQTSPQHCNQQNSCLKARGMLTSQASSC